MAGSASWQLNRCWVLLDAPHQRERIPTRWKGVAGLSRDGGDALVQVRKGRQVEYLMPARPKQAWVLKVPGGGNRERDEGLSLLFIAQGFGRVSRLPPEAGAQGGCGDDPRRRSTRGC